MLSRLLEVSSGQLSLWLRPALRALANFNVEDDTIRNELISVCVETALCTCHVDADCSCVVAERVSTSPCSSAPCTRRGGESSGAAMRYQCGADRTHKGSTDPCVSASAWRHHQEVEMCGLCGDETVRS